MKEIFVGHERCGLDSPVGGRWEHATGTVGCIKSRRFMKALRLDYQFPRNSASVKLVRYRKEKNGRETKIRNKTNAP
jgi:hypothetical protein